MEWSMEFLLHILIVPLGIAMVLGYHAYLWKKLISGDKHHVFVPEVNNRARKKLLEDLMGENATNDKKNIYVVQTLRNHIMAASLLATLSVMLMAGAGAIFSTSRPSSSNSSPPFRVEVSPLAESIGVDLGNNEVLLSVKFALSVSCLALSFLLSTQSVRLLGALNVMINVPPHSPLLISSSYLVKLYDVAFVLSMFAGRAMYVGCCMFLWIMGPWPVFVGCVVLIYVFYKHDFYSPKGSDSGGLADAYHLT